MLFKRFFTNKEVTKDSYRPKRKDNKAQNKKSRIIKIPVTQLRIGMYIRDIDIGWEKSNFLFQGFEITKQEEIAQLHAQCEFVWVDSFLHLAQSVKKEVTLTRSAPDSLLEVEDEYKDALKTSIKTRHVVTQIFSDLRSDSTFEVSGIRQSIKYSIDSIIRNPDASIWLTRLQDCNDSLVTHSMNVMILSIIVGRTLELSNEELGNLGMSAITHDIGKTKLPVALLQKSTPYTAKEQALYETHPQLGFDLLEKEPQVYPGAAKVALYHHKNIDNSGYPVELAVEGIPLYAKIVAIADAYDNATTQKENFSALSPTECLNEIYSKRGGVFDEDLVHTFITGLGVFPAGSIVEMTNGEIGIVLSSTRNKLKPRVILILNEDKEPSAQQVKDLSLDALDRSSQPYQIKTTHADGAFGVIVAEFQKAGLRIG